MRRYAGLRAFVGNLLQKIPKMLTNRGFTGSGGSRALNLRFRIQIQTADVEKDCVAEPIAAAIAAGTLLEPLDPTVHALRVAVAQVQYDGVEDSPQLPLDRLRCCQAFCAHVRPLSCHWPSPFP